MWKLIEKNCKNCEMTFQGRPNSIYCSLLCANNDNKTQFKKGIVPWNKGTKDIMVAWNKGIKGSVKHTEESKRKIGLNGFHYGMLGKKHSIETKSLMSDAHQGDKSYNWQGGITKISAKIRNSFKYRQWRSDVFTRDSFTCQECGQIGGKLNADHIEPFSVKGSVSSCRVLWS